MIRYLRVLMLQRLSVVFYECISLLVSYENGITGLLIKNLAQNSGSLWLSLCEDGKLTPKGITSQHFVVR
jgi:hypothetical protein